MHNIYIYINKFPHYHLSLMINYNVHKYLDKNNPLFYYSALQRFERLFSIHTYPGSCFSTRLFSINPFVPTVAFSQLSSNMCCPRDCLSRHNGGTSGVPLKPLRDDSALSGVPDGIVCVEVSSVVEKREKKMEVV